jgi:hypothetical protein
MLNIPELVNLVLDLKLGQNTYIVDFDIVDIVVNPNLVVFPAANGCMHHCYRYAITGFRIARMMVHMYDCPAKKASMDKIRYKLLTSKKVKAEIADIVFKGAK